MEEKTLAAELIQRVKDYFRDKEHQKEFENWYKNKYGKEFEGNYYHEGKEND